MDAFLNYIRLKAFGRGLRGYHSAWFVVAAAIWMIHRARNQNDVVYRTKLKPGEQLVIEASPPTSPKPSGS
jgi:hypothetical protein